LGVAESRGGGGDGGDQEGIGDQARGLSSNPPTAGGSPLPTPASPAGTLRGEVNGVPSQLEPGPFLPTPGGGFTKKAAGCGVTPPFLSTPCVEGGGLGAEKKGAGSQLAAGLYSPLSPCASTPFVTCGSPKRRGGEKYVLRPQKRYKLKFTGLHPQIYTVNKKTCEFFCG